MIPWFLSDPSRFSQERAEVERLQQTEEWFLGSEWLLCDGDLCLDAVIRAHGYDYEVRMDYPALFPRVPPIVRPRSAEERWSAHQYVNSGTLCLEWGPDNWHSEVTGAQVLASAHNLLNLENPQGEGRPELAIAAPSRHALTTGQKLRGSYGRFYVSEDTIEYISELHNTFGIFNFWTHWRAERWLEVIHEVRPVGEERAWVDLMIPKFLRGKNDTTYNGVFFKTDLDPSSIIGISGVESLSSLLRQAGHRTEVITNGDLSNFANLDGPPSGVLILDRNNEPHCFLLFPENKTLSLAVVRSDSSSSAARKPANLKGLGEKSVGLVGLGSAGSKIAISLARMGVRRFYLVDHDILLPENIERHALDWASIGEHKVDGEKEALLRLGVEFDIEVSRTHLTGQESSALVSGVLNKLGQCDLLIDATADQRVFNLMSAVAAAYEKPVVWLLIYGGGLGGMLARSRPERDPDPQTMRAAYLNYCLERPAPDEPRIAADYTSEDAEGEIISASDADVAIMAHHAARFAVDTLSDGDSSAYPYSMYLIGLARSWVFDAPFATIPIATNHFLTRVEKAEELDQEAMVDNRKFIVSLLEKLRATPPAT